MPLGPREILFVIVLPAVAVLVMIAISWRAWRRSAQRGDWGGPIGIVIAFAIAHRFVAGSWPALPPTESMGWLLVAAVGAAVIGIVDALIPLPTAVRAATSFLVAGGACAIVLQTVMRNWPIGQHVVTLLILALAGLGWWCSIVATARDGGVLAPLVLWIVSSTLAMALMLPPDASLRFGQLTLSLAAAAGAMFMLVLVRPNVSFTRGVPMVFATISVTLIAAAHYLFDWRLIYAVPLLAAPGFVMLGRLIPAPQPTTATRKLARLLIRVAPLVVVMAVVLAVAVIEFRRSESATGYDQELGTAPNDVSTPADVRTI